MNALETIRRPTTLRSATLWPSRQFSALLFNFKFRRRYEEIYSNKHDRFVLREEHIAEMKRLMAEHNTDRAPHLGPLTMSDIVNASLDFAFEHPMAFRYLTSTQNLRESLAREVYQRAFLYFVNHETL
jgi:hypothetical protein